jgi:hypothetical protein
MSLGFELATQGTANMMDAARIEAKPVEGMSPSPFEGFGLGAGMGIMRGGANLARGASLLTTGTLAVAHDRLSSAMGFTPEGSTISQDRNFAEHVSTFKAATDYWTPKPNEVGAAGRVVGSLAEMLLPLGATGGNPGLLVGMAQMNTGEDLIDKGVSADVARATGTWQALATGAGFKVPMLGKNLAERVLFGAASNPLIGAATAAGSADLLKQGGFEEQAKEYNAWDMEARATDTLVGMLFGGVVHLTTPKGEARAARIDPKSDLGKAIDAATETQRDALLTQNLAQHVETGTSPGKPKSMDAKNDHVDAMQNALDELDQGKTVSAHVDPAQFDAVPERDKFRSGIESATETERKALGVEKEPETPQPAGDVAAGDAQGKKAGDTATVDVNAPIEPPIPEGMKIQIPVQVRETGDHVLIERDAREALAETKGKLAELQKLMECIHA